MSQEDFAEATNMHRTYIGGVERGERNVTLLTLWRLADVLEVDPGSLCADPDAYTT